MAIGLFLCTLEAFVRDLFEVTTINSVRFLTRSTKLPNAHAQRPDANFDPRVLGKAPHHHRPQGSHEGGDESHFSVSVRERYSNNFVLRLKKCTEPNGGHIQQML